MEIDTTVVLILGMHRSGTSSLAGSLQDQGVYLGQVHESNPYNKKGNRENPEIMDLNESIFKFNNGSWDAPPDSITWSTEHETVGHQIVQKYDLSNNKVWGFKDPRTLFTLNFWLRVLKLVSSIKYVGTFRHPIAVAKSLQNRNNMTILDGIKLWERYNTRLLEIHEKTNFPLISFDVEPTKYREIIKNISNELKIQHKGIDNNGFFDTSLRHYETNHDISIPDSSLILYHRLQEIFRKQA